MHQSDQVFLKGIDSFKDFKSDMPVIRLRTVNVKTQLTYKRAVNAAGDSLELELMVESCEIMQRILEEMDYRQVTIVIKDRVEMKEGELTLVLDKVARLGDFLELEVLREEADQGEAEKLILQESSRIWLDG